LRGDRALLLLALLALEGTMIGMAAVKWLQTHKDTDNFLVAGI
jgi:hypothetical protein